MHLRPHLGSSGNSEDPESVAHPLFRSSSYPSLPTTQPHFRPGTDRDDPAQPPFRQATFPPDRISIADHTISSSSPHLFQQQQHYHQQHHQQQLQHTPDHSQTFQYYHPDQPSMSSPSSQRDRQYSETAPSFAHPQHPYPTHASHPEQQQQPLHRRHARSSSSLSSHYNGHGQDQDDSFDHDENHNEHQHQNRLFSQTIDGHSAQQQQQQEQRHRHHHHNTPLRDQYDDDLSRSNHAYSQHTQFSPAYSSLPTAHNSIQRQDQQQQHMQHMEQQHQQQRRHTGSSPSHHQTQREYYNNLEQRHLQQQHYQPQHTFNSQTQEGRGPRVSLHNGATQQQHTHGPIGRGQDFESTLNAQQLPPHHQQYRRQQQQQQRSQLQPQSNQPPYRHASLPSSSSPSSHSANPSYSSSLSSSAFFSAQPYLPRSSAAFSSAVASASTLSPSPSASFQRHRARTLSSVSPYFLSSPNPSSSYPSETPTTALDNEAYVSSNARKSSLEWSPRRKRGRANQFTGLGSGGSGGGGHRGGSSSGGGQLTTQATFHQRQSSQDAPMTMAVLSASATTASMSTAIPTSPHVFSYSSSLPSDLWMGEHLISQPSPGSSQTEEDSLRSRLLEQSEDRQWWLQREHFELAKGTGPVGSRSGSGSGPGVTGRTRQDEISALDIPKTYGPNKRPLILSPPVGSDSFAPFDRAFPTNSLGSFLQPNQHQHHLHQHSHQSRQVQQGQQQHQQFVQSQGRNMEVGVVGTRGNEAQEQRAAQQQLRQHNQHNNETTTATIITTVRETLSESVPRTNPTFSSPRRTAQTLPMPHFRGQLVQPQSGDSSYQRRFYSSTHPSIKSSGSTTATAHTTASVGMVSAAGASGFSSSGMMTAGTISSSTLAGRQAGSKPASPLPGISMRKFASVKRLLQLTDDSSSGNNPLNSAGAAQDASGIVSIQLGRLLISTRQHVRGFLDSFIDPRSDSASKVDINAVHPNLERVLLELLNGMLQSHNAFAARDNISSQEQPMTFRPTLVRSLAHLQELLSPTPSYPSSTNNPSTNRSTPIPTHALPSSLSSPSSSPSSPSSPLANGNSDDLNVVDSSRRHRMSSRHPPSRLSTSTSYRPEAMDTETDVDLDTDLLLESGVAGGRATTLNPDIRLRSLSITPVASGVTTPASATTTPLSIGGPAGASTGPADDLDGSTTAADLYRSTIEFLALMTAFVSVVCWLMQTRLLDGGPSNRDPTTAAAEMEGIDMEQDESELGRRDGFTQLKEFLNLFDGLDNVLNPIKEALSRTHSLQQRWPQHVDEQESDTGVDPMDFVGLFAWHYVLFASDRESPFEREAHTIDILSLRLVHFDVILNELYTTHILSMTAKEHQKDHGQFYTPPGVVDFMWKRTTIDRGRLLDHFVESMPSYLSAPLSFVHQECLIPTALDPCLGVSTFLSCYIRLLIQEAQRDHPETIWRSEAACRLLLTQICENVWGIELDGFAFWMARCGILVALMPLVQHVESFSHHTHHHHPHQRPPYHQYQQQQQTQLPQLPRLHLFRSDTLQLTVPDGTSPKTAWDRHCILQLRTPSRLQFDFIVTNPPYMIRKTGTFSAPDPEVYDWSILGASIATAASAAAAAAPTGLSESLGPALKTKSRLSTKASKIAFEEEERLTPSTVDTGDDDSGSEATMTPGSDRLSKGPSESVLQSPRAKKLATQVRPTGSKGMMQAYGYFVWFAAQRIKPGKGVVCMITASQWLTLEFAVKLRAWLFENCLMDEFFQFEPYKVFSKVQTDSLIFKIRAIPHDLLPSTLSSMSSSPLPLGDHRTVFLRHTDHHKPLAGILQDYMVFSANEELQVVRSSSSFVVGAATNNKNELNIMVSRKTREELAAVIMAPSATPTTTSGKGDEATAPATYTYSFAPMLPASVLTTYMLALTQDLGAICSAGTKKMNRLRAVEPLLWHRGPNTNPVYGLVVRMEYARSMFGEEMTSRWFRPALYWNGKNSPEGPPTAATTATGNASSATILAVPSKALHREGQFWQGRDRQRLSKKEGSPAESYCVPTSAPQRMYALCMVDKESVKILRQQVEQRIEGSQALWNYLTDVRSHFQPGLASKRKVASSGKPQAVDDEGVAFCSTNQCGADVPEKIVHPINYGYFSKTQPRQRFFLDTNSLAVTNQCIYLTLNKLSSHYDAEQCPPLIYFLTLLNSTTLQFFVLHHCQYDQQGRMRLFRESMAKIPFQDRDVKNHPERIQYVAQLGSCMIELKNVLYSVVVGWRLTGSHHSSSVSQGSGAAGGRQGSTGGLASIAPYPAAAAPAAPSTTPTSTTGGSSNQGLLDWVRKGGNPPPGLLSRVKDQVRRMLVAQASNPRRHPYQAPEPVATSSGITAHSIKARPSSSAPSLSSSSSILHLNKPRGIKAGAMGSGGGAAFFTDTDTDTNTFTDTDTDTDDTMDPWMVSRLEGKVSTGVMGRGIVSTTNTSAGYQNPNQSNRGQSQHSLARILNMPGDDSETSMDEEGTTSSMTNIPLTMPVPIPERGSRDRRASSFRPTVGGEFGNDEEFNGDESKTARSAPAGSTAMETDLDELYHHNPAASATTFNSSSHQQQQRQQKVGGVASSFDDQQSQISLDCDRILRAIERAVTMVEMVQWAVDQYGYMLYGIRPKFQKLLELDLKIVYGSRLESMILPTTPLPSSTTAAPRFGVGIGENGQATASSLGITVWDLYRWEGDSESMAPLLPPGPAPGPALTSNVSCSPSGSAPGNSEGRQMLPTYASQVLENAQSATQLLREILDQFPALPSPSSAPSAV